MTYPMFDPLLDAVLVIGPLKEIYYCNDAAVNLFELPRKKMTSGTPCYELLTFDDPDLFIMPDGTKGEDKPAPYREVHFLSRSGKKGLVQVSILPSSERFGVSKLWFVYFHDVTLEENLHKKYRFQIEEKEKTIEQLKNLQTQTSDLKLINELRSPLEKLEKTLSQLAGKTHLSPADLKSIQPLIEEVNSNAKQILARNP